MDVAFLVPEASENTMLTVLVWQLGLGVVLAATFWIFGGNVAGYSALLGSLTAVIPNAFLALRLAVPRRDPGARSLVRAAYIGELGKLALTIVMFIIVFTLVRPLAAAPLFAAFIGTQLVTLLGFLLRDKEQQELEQSTKHGD
ncbi:MAG: ATP synthase subunit I [Woeseiaceae bacterium]|nr:ATP synthase subunit I [Woeseiaceae bacterium]